MCSFPSAAGQSAPLVSTGSSSASARLPRCHYRSTPTCFAMPAGSSSPMMATTRGRCSTTLGTRTSSTRSGTPKWRRTGSKTFGEADLRPWASLCRRFRAPASSGRLPLPPSITVAFAPIPRSRIKVSSASRVRSSCSSVIALTPPECSNFISRGTSMAQTLRYAAGDSRRTRLNTSRPCCCQSSARSSRNRLLNARRVASGEPPAHLRVPSARVRIDSTGALDLPRIPAAHALDELVGFLRPPRAGLVLVHRAGAMNDRVNDGPGGLDDVLAGEERGGAEHRVAEQPLVRLHAAAGALRGGVEHAELDGLSDHALTRFLRTRADRDLHLGTQPEAHVVAHVRSRLLGHHLRRVVQLDEDLGHRLLEALARAHEERHAGPTPRVDPQLERRVRRHVGVLRDARLVAVSLELAAHHALGAHRPHRAQHLRLLVANGLGVRRRGRLHREVADDLQEVVLDHVANDAGLVVELAAALHAEALGERDLHVLDVVAVEDRLKKRVREAEVENVLHRFLAQVVVDAEH